MASTYSSLKIELISTGEQSGTWGNTTNVNLGTAIEEAITGSADVPFSSADVTLTLTNSNASQTARNLRLNLTGTSGGARNLTVPDIEKFYIVTNGLANDVTVKNTTGTTYTVPAGTTAQLFSTGTGVKDAISFFAGSLLSSAAVILGGAIDATPIGAVAASTGRFTTLNASGSVTFTSALGVASGGTGAATLAANNVLLGNGTSAVQVVAPGTNGNILTSNGTTWVSSPAPATGVTSFQTSLGGLTPSTSTTGAVTLAGTLNVGSGGTGVTTFTSGALLKGNTTGAIQTASAADIVGQIGSTAVTNATNATNITNAGGWNVTPSGTNLYFNYNGTNVGVLTSTGDFTVIGNVTAYGTI